MDISISLTLNEGAANSGKVSISIRELLGEWHT